MAAEFDALARLRTRLAVLTWLAGVNLAATLLVAGTVFAVWSRFGELSGQIAVLAARLR